MIKPLRSYIHKIIVIISLVTLVIVGVTFWDIWRATSERYDDRVLYHLDHVSLYLDRQLHNYRRNIQFWGMEGLSDEGRRFIMSLPVSRGFLRCDRSGVITWSNLSYAHEGMTVPRYLIKGRWVLSSMLGDMSSPGLVVSVPIPSGWMIAEIDAAQLLSTIRLSNDSFDSMVLASTDGVVLYSWGDAPIWPVGTSLPLKLVRQRRLWSDVSAGRIRSFSRPLQGGLSIVAFYNRNEIVAYSAKRALWGAAMMLLGSVLALAIFWRSFRMVTKSFVKWAQFLSDASQKLRKTSSSLELFEDLSALEVEVGQIKPSFQEGQNLGDAFKDLIHTIEIQEESLAVLLEETLAMEKNQKETSSQLDLAMGQLENVLSLVRGVTHGNNLKGIADILTHNLKKTFKCSYAGLVALREGEPYIWGESDHCMSDASMDMVKEIPEVPAFSGDNVIFPVSFMERSIGCVVIEGCFEYSGENVSDVLLRFALTLGVLLHANELLSEVRSSFHYFALRMQAITELYHDETGAHIARVGAYSAFIAQKLGLSEGYVEDVRIYSQLHDIGKIKVDRSMLVKPGKLNSYERAEVQKHSVYGAELIGKSDWLKMARDICMYHHERWNGSGYPSGLKGTEIPVAARIVSLCDVYDALRGERSYKGAFSHEVASRIILEGDGRVMPTYFDPNVLEIFRDNHGVFNEIYESMRLNF